MPITKTITLYTFDELPTEKAKDVARAWFREAAIPDDVAWEQVKEDASQIGLSISVLSDRRSNEGSFIDSARHTIQAILKQHGEDCETYKTANNYAKRIDDAYADTLEPDAPQDAYDVLEDAEHKFLHSLLEDYRVMLEKEIDHQNSDEAVAESICCNDYTFTETGKREDI